jgi:hypothetical protein
MGEMTVGYVQGKSKQFVAGRSRSAAQNKGAWKTDVNFLMACHISLKLNRDIREKTVFIALYHSHMTLNLSTEKINLTVKNHARKRKSLVRGSVESWPF